jgi:hypothetical protein
VRQDEMIAMTVVAGGGNDESSFKETFSMNTLGVVS